MHLRPARPDEAGLLGDIAYAAKQYWGYDQPLLDAFRRDLRFTPAEVEPRRIVIAEIGGVPRGFYSIDGDPPHGELGNMWVVPSAIGTGLGRALYEHALTAARREGFTRLDIQADPNAEGFYLAMGAVRVGERESSAVPGRMLPLLEATI